MKIVCIENLDSLRITLGNVYNVIEEDSIGYKIINDDGNCQYYTKERFRGLNEIRDRKLNDLGI